MRFEARHQLKGTVDEVERALFDERYLPFVIAHHGSLLEAQVLEKRDDGARLTRRVRYLPRPVIEHIGPNTVPPEWFAFIEDSTWDRTRRELTFKNTPTSHAIEGMLHNVGTMRFRDVAGHCERTMEGEISLKLPFILKPVALLGEAVIHREGLKILDGEAAVMNRFLAEVLRAK